MKYPCPACGFIVFSDPPGSYEICPICQWEDDHVQLKFPGLGVGANELSLYEFQLSVLNKIPADINELKGFQRDVTWRPLEIEECIVPSNLPKKDTEEIFSSPVDTFENYYWESSSVDL